MSTAREREAALRRALLNAAAQIEPAPGGLERIQARLGRPVPLPVAWLEAAWTCLQMRAPVIATAARRRAGELVRLAAERFSPASAPGARQRRLSWLRPLAAMSVAIFVLGAGAYIALDRPTYIFSNGSGYMDSGGRQPGGSASLRHRTTLARGAQPVYIGGPSRSPSPSCSPSPTTTSTGSPPPGPAMSQPASTPPPTATPSPSASASTSPSPGGSASPSSGSAAGGANAGQPGGTGASAGAGTASGGSSASPSTGPATHAAHSGTSTASTGKTQTYAPCKPKPKAHRTASPSASGSAQTSAKRAGSQAGRPAAAKLD